MKEILLTQGKVAFVDDQDFEELSKYKWYALKSSNTFYALRGVFRKGRRWAYSMHRTILGLPKGVKTDHRDGNGLNNQRENLRIATTRQNGQGFRTKTGLGSKFRGVVWHPKNQKWQAQIKVNGKQIYLGQFPEEIAAAKEYDTAARKFFGEFATCNFSELV